MRWNKVRKQLRHLIMKCMNYMMHFHKNSFGQERTNESWNSVNDFRKKTFKFEVKLMTLRKKAFNLRASFPRQIIATSRRANNYRSLIMKCMNYMMHFHTQNINLKSVNSLRHLIMKCMNYMMHFHIQTITLH